jgi:flagellar protein FlgJ
MQSIGDSSTSFYSGAATAVKDPKKVAGMFEALFYRTMLRQVRESSMGDPLFESSATKQAQEMMDDEMAVELGKKGDLGIANMMLEMIEKRESPTGLLK